MPYALELPASGKLVILPTRWQDVTLAQADALGDGTDLYDYVALLCGVSPHEVMQWPAEVLTPELVDALAFLREPLPDLATLPVPVALVLPREASPLGWVSLPVPQDLSALSFGQAADLGAVLLDTTLTPYQQHARALAIYFYALYYRCPYDSDGTEAFADICAQATLAEALPITAFFLRSTPASDGSTRLGSSPSQLRPPRKRRGWRSWCASGIRWPSWMRWPGATRPAGPTSSP